MNTLSGQLASFIVVVDFIVYGVKGFILLKVILDRVRKGGLNCYQV